MKEEQAFGLFVVNFAITLIYFFIILSHRKTTEQENKIHYTFLFLILFLISAYSLNREMSVFEDSAAWFSAILVLCCANYAAFAFADTLPRWAVHLMSFISGVSWVAFLYLAIYLLPIYVIGIAGFILFGVSLHTFVPLLFTIYTLKLVNKTAGVNKKYWLSFILGVVAPVTFVLTYAIAWSDAKKEIDSAWYDSIKIKNDLPAWVNAAQKIPDNSLTRKLLKTGLVYSIPEAVSAADDFFWRMPGRNIGESKKHDPLVMTASFLTGKIGLDDEAKIKILESMFRLQHEAGERLWPGDHLYTENVNTEVKFWPACNMTYTEKTLTVTNNNTSSPWRRQEEALYTFFMPEGAVVTSLSLWINGKEEKGIMTSRAKADSAYKSIVGVEKRDPSLVHWQEGNSVSVRVFPVLAGENRIFKIGITAPMERVNGKLRYENIYFKGPAYNDAKENILIDFEQPVNDFQLPASFTSMSRQSYKRKGKYDPLWSMLINDPGLSGCSFSFDDHTYSLLPYHKKLSAVQLETFYLDINKAWSKDEFSQIIDLTKDKNVYVFDSVIKKLDAGNRDELWASLHAKQFSLFPLFEISKPDQSLLITKNPSISPCIDDLEESVFIKKTKSFLLNNQKIKLYDFGDGLSPYLKSMKEFRVFQYDKGDINQLQGLLQKSYFPDDLENDNEVIIHKSDMIIQKSEGMHPSSGPDHLMRLFTYNHIMQKLGSGQLTGRAVEDSLVEEARKAYVVTPVSSLVVLETQKDYDRFDIKDANTSLKNASLQSKGAVPEPHEWAIIIMILLLMSFIIRMNKLRYN
jgi:XrtN system VIT domain protein